MTRDGPTPYVLRFTHYVLRKAALDAEAPTQHSALSTQHWLVWLRRALMGWLLGQASLRLWRKLRPRSRPGWLDWEPTRQLRWLIWPSEVIVERIGLLPGMRVVDVGAGTSQLTMTLARAVGSTGQVLAIDERPRLVERLQIDALEQGLPQVVVQQAAPTALPDRAMESDLVVFTATFGGMPDKQAVANEAYRALRPGGAMAVTELLVDPDYSLASTVVTYLVLAGFGIERELGGFAGYTVIGRKAVASG
jgi:precorrin-6B methylase 2